MAAVGVATVGQIAINAVIRKTTPRMGAAVGSSGTILTTEPNDYHSECGLAPVRDECTPGMSTKNDIHCNDEIDTHHWC